MALPSSEGGGDFKRAWKAAGLQPSRTIIGHLRVIGRRILPHQLRMCCHYEFCCKWLVTDWLTAWGIESVMRPLLWVLGGTRTHILGTSIHTHTLSHTHNHCAKEPARLTLYCLSRLSAVWCSSDGELILVHTHCKSPVQRWERSEWWQRRSTDTHGLVKSSCRKTLSQQSSPEIGGKKVSFRLAFQIQISHIILDCVS